jgi:hypothetical protein
MICTKEDDFTFEKPRWLAVLNSGKTVIQDDYRPGLANHSAWLRLKEYIEETGDNIVELKLQFRSNHESPLPKNADGYFFSHMLASVNGGENIGFFVIGWVEDGKLQVQKWHVPSLLREETMDETRGTESEAIIWTRKTTG